LLCWFFSNWSILQ